MPGQIKILHLVASNFLGGPEKQIINHLKYCDRDKYRIVVGSYIEKGAANEFLEAARDSGADILSIDHKSLLDFSPIEKIARYVTDSGMDVIISHGYKSNIFGYLAKNKAKVPQAMYARGWTAENNKVKLYNWLERKFIKKGDLIITVAKRKLNELEKLGIAKTKLRYIGNAIELPDLDKIEFRDIYADFDVPSPRLIILAAGRLSPEKGHIILLNALKIIAERGVKFYCIIFGDGPLLGRLKKAAADLQIDSDIKFAGFNRDWQKYLNENVLLVNPSISEVMPNVVLEGMAHRAPVLATDVGGVSELIIDNETGFLIPPNDPGELAEKALYFNSNRPKLKYIIDNARAHVENSFSYEKQARALEAVYDELYYLKSAQGILSKKE